MDCGCRKAGPSFPGNGSWRGNLPTSIHLQYCTTGPVHPMYVAVRLFRVEIFCGFLHLHSRTDQIVDLTLILKRDTMQGLESPPRLSFRYPSSRTTVQYGEESSRLVGCKILSSVYFFAKVFAVRRSVSLDT